MARLSRAVLSPLPRARRKSLPAAAARRRAPQAPRYSRSSYARFSTGIAPPRTRPPMIRRHARARLRGITVQIDVRDPNLLQQRGELFCVFFNPVFLRRGRRSARPRRARRTAAKALVLFRRAVAAAQQHVEPLFAHSALNFFERFPEKRVGNIGHEYAHGIRTAGDEAARRRVGTITQFFRRRPHLFFRLLRNADLFSVEDLRNSGNRTARIPPPLPGWSLSFPSFLPTKTF